MLEKQYRCAIFCSIIWQWPVTPLLLLYFKLISVGSQTRRANHALSDDCKHYCKQWRPSHTGDNKLSSYMSLKHTPHIRLHKQMQSMLSLTISEYHYQIISSVNISNCQIKHTTTFIMVTAASKNISTKIGNAMK